MLENLSETVNWPTRTMSFDRPEVPCIWIPEGDELSPTILWSNPAIFSAMLIPDGYQGPRPGYPWIEFGRMTLPVGEAGSGQTAGSAATTAMTRPSPLGSDGEPRVVAFDQLDAGPPAPGIRNSDETRLATNADPDLGATIRNVLSDLGAAMTALDALSPSNPLVASVAQGIAARSPAREPGRRGSADESPSRWRS